MSSSPATGLVAACDDQRLLAFDLWPRQRELLEAVEEGPRLHVWACGRRSGKTTLAALVGLHDCLLRPELAQLVRPGERRYAVAVATSQRQAALFVAAARSIVERSPMLKRLVESVTDEAIYFSNGTALAAFPCSSRGARGWPISTLLLDEAAHFLSETDGPQAAERVWSALVPSTAQFADRARIIAASTPYGTSGLFARIFQQAESGELPDALAQHAPTAAVNPLVDADFLERERQRDPDSFRSEYLAEFVASGGAFLPWQAIRHAIDENRRELPPEACTRTAAAIDPAFASDPFGLVIVDRDGERLRLALARSWRPPRDGRLGAAVLDEVADECLRYGVTDVLTDQASAELVADHLLRRGLRVRKRSMTPQTKNAAYLSMKARLLDGSLELYRHEELVAELARIEATYSAGRSAIRIPRVGGSHGDVAQALALVCGELPARHGTGGGVAGVIHHRPLRARDEDDGDFDPRSGDRAEIEAARAAEARETTRAYSEYDDEPEPERDTRPERLGPRERAALKPPPGTCVYCGRTNADEPLRIGRRSTVCDPCLRPENRPKAA